VPKVGTCAPSERQIVDFGYQTIRFKPGDSVRAWAIIQNNLENVTISYVGFSVKDPNNMWFDAHYVVVILPPKAMSDTILLSWKVPSNAVLGFYAVKIAVWKGTVAGMLSERLDYREHSHAFFVTREIPPLAFIVNFSFSILPNVVSSFLRKDPKTAYRRLGYYGILCVGYAIFILTLPNVPYELKVIGYCFEAWGILTILIGLNLSSLVKKLSQNMKDLILWIFDYKNPASFQMAILTYYFLLPTFLPSETLPLSPNILVINCLLFLLFFNSTIIFRMLKKIISRLQRACMQVKEKMLPLLQKYISNPI